MNTPSELSTKILVVGGGTGGTAAAIQAARRGVKTILVSEFPWLGGMLTAAGVSAPDGNELVAWQTGLWGAFLTALHRRQLSGLHHSWVSFFTYEPAVGAAIFADWVRGLADLTWIAGQRPVEVLRQGDRVTGVRFPDYLIHADLTLDATELGDVLALGEIPYRWGWDWHPDWQEPSAPQQATELTQRYPVQAPTWVVLLQDFGQDRAVPIPPPPNYQPERYVGAWHGYTPESFLNYGRLPNDRLMINWPQRGNDYGEGLERLVQTEAAYHCFLQESFWHSQGLAHFIQSELGLRYGLAAQSFPVWPRGVAEPDALAITAFALHPYFRESRRLCGLKTICELDILPLPQAQVAALPLNASGEMDSIAIGNYANDHHYPGHTLPLQPKSLHWGGRWTGTPFTLPYGALVPLTVDGLLVCEKNISVSHIANGATRLQPVVMAIGQAAGMAAALCIEQQCQPRDLSVGLLQDALLQDDFAPAAIVPLFNLPPQHEEWLFWQSYYRDHPDRYPPCGMAPLSSLTMAPSRWPEPNVMIFQGRLEIVPSLGQSLYQLSIQQPPEYAGQVISVVTLDAAVHQWLTHLPSGCEVAVEGSLNRSGPWLRVDRYLFPDQRQQHS